VLFDYFDDLNWLAVIVAALAFWVLGAIWYSDALFGRQWRAAAGVDEMKPTAQQIVGNLVTWFISALVLGLIAKGIGAENVGDGLVLGLVVSFGFIGTNRITQQLYEGGKGPLMKVNAPYTLLGFAIMGIILATWT
jgi:hypothetical protein